MSDDDDAATQWPTAQSYGKLSRADAALYLDRLGLSRELLDAAPSLELLRDLQSNHITHVPFESLSVHVSDWSNDEAPVNLGGGETVGLGETAFRRIVHLKRGGYCFSLNSTFALLLRRFGFRVSEQAARVFAHLGQDPAVSGYDWGTTSHQCAIVDWEGSDGRYFVDVGFGSTQPLFPIPFTDGATVESIPSEELYRLRREQVLPYTNAPPLPDTLPHYLLEHRDFSSEGREFWSPVYAFTQQTIKFRDQIGFNFYSSRHPSATFVNFFVSTIHRPNGDRRSLFYKQGMVKEGSTDGRPFAKLQTTAGPLREGEKPGSCNRKEREVEWVEMRVDAIKAVLERETGMVFPPDYCGN